MLLWEAAGKLQVLAPAVSLALLPSSTHWKGCLGHRSCPCPCPCPCGRAWGQRAEELAGGAMQAAPLLGEGWNRIC